MRLGKKGEFVGFTLLALLVMGLFFVSFGDLKISGYAVYSGDGDCGSYVNESSTLSGNINCNNTGLFINANNIELDCQGYNITYNLNGTDDKYGIYNYQFDNVTIKNCGVIEGNSSGNNSYGIYYYDQTDNGTILNNSITIESVNADGIRVYTSTNHEILNNTLVANGNNSAGIFIGRSNENEVYNNNITINNSNGKGIYVYRDSHNNTFNQNTINDNGNGAKGFLIYDGGTPCLNNILMNNSITVDGLDLDIVGGNNDTWLIDQIISNYSIQPGATININNSWGIIEFSDLIEVVGNNLSGDIQISNNSIYVNSSNSGLNRSAELTFYNITGITNPIPYRNNEKCEDAICTGFTNLGNWTYSFNVASWSNYSIEEDIINCGKYVNNNLILTGNLNCEGTGLFINDSDVEIDCNGSNIQFGNSGDNYSAIENIGFNNITIKDCTINQTGEYDEKDGIYLKNSENATIINNNIEIRADNSFGIFLYRYNNSNITNNTINVIEGANSKAIVLFNSKDNNLTSNSMTVGSKKLGIHLANLAERNTLSQNSISGAGSGITLSSILGRISEGYVAQSSFNNILTNNSVSCSDLNLNITSGHNDTWLIDQPITGYSILDSLINFKDSTHGIIEYLNPINESGENLSSDIQISNNLINVNGSKSGLNKSATLTFYGYACAICNSFAPYRNGAVCAGECSEFININGQDYKFKVNGFTNYSIGEDSLTCEKTITTSNSNLVMGINLNCDGNGLIIGAHNVVIDCNTHRISYGINGSNNHYAIKNNGYSNLTIRNCNIIQENASGGDSHGIYSYNDSTFSGIGFLNNDITTVGNESHGIYLIYHNDVNIYNNTINASGINSTELVLVNTSEILLTEQSIESYDITNSKFGFNESDGSLDYLEFINANGTNLSNNVIIESNSIQINTSNDDLNQNALLTFREVTNVSSGSKNPIALLSGVSCGSYCSGFDGDSDNNLYWFTRIGSGALSGVKNYSVGYESIASESTPGSSGTTEEEEEIEVITQYVYNITDEDIPSFGNPYPIGFVANRYPTIGGSSNEPANCKFDFKDTSYYLMNYTFSGPAILDAVPSSFNTMHSYTFVKPLDFGNQTIYVRCTDAYKNDALSSYSFSFEIVNIAERIEKESQKLSAEMAEDLSGKAYAGFMVTSNNIWTWLIYIGLIVLFVGFYVLSHHTSKKILNHLEDPVKEIVKNIDLSVKKIYFFLMVREIKNAKEEYGKLKKLYLKIPNNFIEERKKLHSYIISIYNKINDVAEKKK